MDDKHKKVRQELDELGYYQLLSRESSPLVEKLLADLKTTTQSLQKYMKIAQRAIEERDRLQLGAEPYKHDNARLVRECNDLHLILLQTKEQQEKEQKDLKRRLDLVKSEHSNCSLELDKLRKEIQSLQTELIECSESALSLQTKGSKGKQLRSSASVPTQLSQSKPPRKAKNFEISSAMALADQKISNLSKEVRKLKEQNLELADANEILQCQCRNRDKEIGRLSKLLEGGRPLEALTKECPCMGPSEGLSALQDQVNRLTQEKCMLERQLQDSLTKQHEAMKRALNLAERNKLLEKEMKDIDHLALAVEAECNSTVKSNTEKVHRLQNRLHNTVIQLQCLERENAKVKQEKQELSTDLESVITEKRHLQTVLETTLDEKKRLTDRINNFTRIEHDLNLEIDRLMQLSASQKQRIAELENSLVSEKARPAEFTESRSRLYARQGDNIGSAEEVVTRGPKSKTSAEHLPAEPSEYHPRLPSRHSATTIQGLAEDINSRVPKSVQTDFEPIYESQPRLSKTRSPTRSPPRGGGGGKSKSNGANTKKKNAIHTKNIAGARKKNASPQRVPSPAFVVPENTPADDNGRDLLGEHCKCCRCCCASCCGSSSRHLRELLGKELEYREQQVRIQASRCMDNLKSEKEYYMQEYHKMLDQMRNQPGPPENNEELTRKLAEKEQLLTTLQHENKILAQEKYNLMSRLETARDNPPDTDREGSCLKVTCKRTERERDLLRADLERLEEEKTDLMQQLQAVTDAQAKQEDRYRRTLSDLEEQLHQVELEKRDLMQGQGSRRSAIDTLEKQCDNLRDQLRLTQNELSNQKALYAQLKTLQEQTDRALHDTQAQLLQAESELTAARDELRRRDDDRVVNTRELDMLKEDLRVMKTQLTQIDTEKDELLATLDEKTEKLATMETHLKERDKQIASLEATINELNRRISSTADQSASQDNLLRSTQTEITKLRQQLESANRIKDDALSENRRLQDDLASVTLDCRDARKELDLYKRQVDDLKTQLQHYVAEVKRVEDLISNKEVERNQLLDQFRSLSQEANMLETNNHTLETEATQSKVQLSVALEHAANLERKLENQESIIRSYEKQIAELTSQIASLEVHMKQNTMINERSDTELVRVREYCAELEAENQRIKRQMREQEDQRVQASRSAEQLRTERETLQRTIAKDKHSVESMEQLLNDAKQESTELRLLNQDLREDVQRLNSKLQEVQEKLAITSNQLDMYQEKALDYSQQNKQLRREIANERFRRTRDSDSGRSPPSYTSVDNSHKKIPMIPESDTSEGPENKPANNKPRKDQIPADAEDLPKIYGDCKAVQCKCLENKNLTQQRMRSSNSTKSHQKKHRKYYEEDDKVPCASRYLIAVGESQDAACQCTSSRLLVQKNLRSSTDKEYSSSPSSSSVGVANGTRKSDMVCGPCCRKNFSNEDVANANRRSFKSSLTLDGFTLKSYTAKCKCMVVPERSGGNNRLQQHQQHSPKSSS